MTGTKDLVRVGDFVLPKAQFDLVTRTVAAGLDENEMGLFFYECKRRGVHPLDRMIYAIKRKDNSSEGAPAKMTFQCSIDYYRAAAEDTGKYCGQLPVTFGPEIPLSKACPKTGAGHDDIMVPEWAEATVLRKGEDGEQIKISARAKFIEYYPGEKNGHMWRKMPSGQIAKCAEALTLRKAFPRKLGGIYTNEEIERDISEIPFAKTDTVKSLPKQQPYQKSASPAPQSEPQREPGSDEGEAPKKFWPLPPQCDSHVKVSLYNEVMTLASGNPDAAFDILKEASKFDSTDGNVVFLNIKNMDRPKWTDPWAGRVLNKLRDKK